MRRVLFGVLLLAVAIVSQLSKPSWDTRGFYFFGVFGSLLIHLELLSWVKERFRWDLDLEDSYLRRIENAPLLVASARELSKKVHVAFCVAGFSVGWVVFAPLATTAHPILTLFMLPFIGYAVTGMAVLFAGIFLSYMSKSLLSPISQHAHMEFCAALRAPFITIACITLTAFCGVFLWLPF